MRCSRQTANANGCPRYGFASASIALVLLMTGPVTSIRADASLELAEFTGNDASPDWFVVNDNVMGGRSDGDFVIEQGQLRFSGATNTNGGGFSSIRTSPINVDLSAFNGIRLTVKGDGRRYTWRLTTDARWQGREIAYWADFETEEGRWTDVDVPFSRFVPRYRGSRLDGPPLNPKAVTGMGLMIYDGKDGPFEIRLKAVSAFSARPSFALSQYQWQNRVLIASADAPNDPQLVSLEDERAKTGEEFADRDLILVTLLSTGESMAGNRVLTPDEVASARETLGLTTTDFALRLIGKDGTVKLSTDSAVPIAEVYALIDTMPMRRNELSRR
jgi:NADH dehydrogenase [ubiquinone] 1 alpha subcomplex assembly factor 1